MKVRLRHDGTLASAPAIARSSGHDLLDAEALRMVQRAAPYPPLPAGYGPELAELQVPVRFFLED